MSTIDQPVTTSYAQASTKTLTTGGVTFAYRELGPREEIPVVFFVHLAATLDNWDPRVIDAIAQTRHVITFDQRGVGASSGTVPNTIEDAADDAYTFITALGFEQIDAFTFSMGGFIAQDLIVKHPDLVRRLVLAGTGPRGGKNIDKMMRVTYWDVFRSTITRADAKEYLFFNRDKLGKKAGKAFVERLKERADDRRQARQFRGNPYPTEGHPALRPLRLIGPVGNHAAHTDRQRRQRPHGSLHPLRRPAPADQGIRADHLPKLRTRRRLPVLGAVRSRRRRIPRTLICRGRVP